ncbi:MAG: 4'-phosphopantetheinyl transferase superfamily protein [Ruminococcus sp.]|nr:4'-phosphopantetheinyl transferase superfamily protein [Ruminococcus sp.]
MTEFYFTNIKNISLSELNLSKIPKYRREKIARLPSGSDKLRSLAAGLLIEKFIGNKEIKNGKYGKPYCEGGRCFNLSHSGDYVILAVSDCEVGCDIECVRFLDYERLGKKVFHENEREKLGNLSDKQDCFFEIWTRKEAFVKFLGEGFHFKMTSLDLSDLPEKFEYNNRTCFFKEYMLCGFKIMLCCEKNDFPEDIIEIKFN